MNAAAGFERALRAARIVPVLTIERADQAVPLARALVAGGLPVLEVTLRTPAAAEAARRIMAEVPGALVGLGTLLRPHDIDLALELGARFAVSPGATPALLEAAARHAGALPFMPGAATASEAMAARDAGFTLLKIFPAEAAGGLALLRGLSGPLPELRFCPTGGIDDRNGADYLALRSVVAVGGSWVAPAADIAAGAWDRITERARASRRALGDEAPVPV
jgi:2-dehydro-3-deoxyphosphogluconate aldolase/(4S)-4-hydroxy-2-oxoglutarate aldolase